MDFKLVFLVVAFVVIVRARKIENTPQLNEVAQKCTTGRRTVSLNDDCRTYVSCRDLGIGRPVIQYCAAGTLYDPENQICNHAQLVDCSSFNSIDPCNSLADGFQRDTLLSKDDQAAVLVCAGSRTFGGYRCDVCNSFGASENGCVPISGCTRTADEIVYDCSLIAVENSNTQYINAGVKTRTVMDCANGTMFSQEICGCA